MPSHRLAEKSLWLFFMWIAKSWMRSVRMATVIKLCHAWSCSTTQQHTLHLCRACVAWKASKLLLQDGVTKAPELGCGCDVWPQILYLDTVWCAPWCVVNESTPCQQDLVACRPWGLRGAHEHHTGMHRVTSNAPSGGLVTGSITFIHLHSDVVVDTHRTPCSPMHPCCVCNADSSWLPTLAVSWRDSCDSMAVDGWTS